MRLDAHAGAREVLERTLDRLRRKDADTDRDVVRHLLDEYRSGGLATIGARNTLSALDNGQVDTLVLSASPDAIVTVDEQAPQELVRRARLTSASIRFIEDPTLLSGIGGVGAFLRFRA